MYRGSSKGNPYHDARGRFARKDGMMSEEAAMEEGLLVKDDNGEVLEDKRTVMWSAFGEQKDVRNLDAAQADKVDRETTKSHLEDGQRFYHNQSIQREKNAKKVAAYKVPKGTPRSERSALMEKSKAAFEKENAVALKNGAQVRVFFAGQNVEYQIVEAGRLAKKSSIKDKPVTFNTGTGMQLFHGYTVEYYKGNEVRSCKKNTTLSEAREHLAKYCMKHKKVLSDPDVCLKVWRSKKDDRVFYMPTFFFESEADAQAFAKKHQGARVVNHDSGSQA